VCVCIDIYIFILLLLLLCSHVSNQLGLDPELRFGQRLLTVVRQLNNNNYNYKNNEIIIMFKCISLLATRTTTYETRLINRELYLLLVKVLEQVRVYAGGFISCIFHFFPFSRLHFPGTHMSTIDVCFFCARILSAFACDNVNDNCDFSLSMTQRRTIFVARCYTLQQGIAN